MAPSLLQLGVAALAYAGSASAKKWHLTDKYDHKNFFDKFNFFEVVNPWLYTKKVANKACM